MVCFQQYFVISLSRTLNHESYARCHALNQTVDGGLVQTIPLHVFCGIPTRGLKCRSNSPSSNNADALPLTKAVVNFFSVIVTNDIWNSRSSRRQQRPKSRSCTSRFNVNVVNTSRVGRMMSIHRCLRSLKRQKWRKIRSGISQLSSVRF